MGNSVAYSIGLRLASMNTALYITLFVVLKLLLNYASNVVNRLAEREPLTTGFEEIVNAHMTFIVVVVGAPLLETYVSQYLFFKYLSGRLNNWLIVLLSALFFCSISSLQCRVCFLCIPIGSVIINKLFFLFEYECICMNGAYSINPQFYWFCLQPLLRRLVKLCCFQKTKIVATCLEKFQTVRMLTFIPRTLQAIHL